MRKQIVDLLENQELKRYIRQDPIWYRRLTRNPLDINTFRHSAKIYNQKTFPQKFERAVNSIELAAMMMQMFKSMKNND